MRQNSLYFQMLVKSLERGRVEYINLYLSLISVKVGYLIMILKESSEKVYGAKSGAKRERLNESDRKLERPGKRLLSAKGVNKVIMPNTMETAVNSWFPRDDEV